MHAGEDLAIWYVAATRVEKLLVHRSLPKGKDHLLTVRANQINKWATA